jgi:hypothetical protein
LSLSATIIDHPLRLVGHHGWDDKYEFIFFLPKNIVF